MNKMCSDGECCSDTEGDSSLATMHSPRNVSALFLSRFSLPIRQF